MRARQPRTMSAFHPLRTVSASNWEGKLKARLLLVALALQSCGPNVDPTHPDLHIERFGGTNWEATLYEIRTPPRQTYPEAYIDPRIQPDELTTAIHHLTSLHGGGSNGVVALLAEVKAAPECERVSKSSPLESISKSNNCVAQSDILTRVNKASDGRFYRVLCLSRVQDSCLIATVRLDYLDIPIDEESICIRSSEVCLYAIGYDRSRNLWVICTTPARLPRLKRETAVLSKSCLLQYHRDQWVEVLQGL